MIGPGWIPGRPRPLVRKRTLPYTRRRSSRRRVPKAAPQPRAGDTEVMLFDQVRELPVATVRRAPRTLLPRLAGDLSRWLLARWEWFRPRMIPVAVALVGMLAVLRAVDYLSHPHTGAADPAHAQAGSSGLMYVDGTLYRDGAPVAAPDRGFRVRLVVQP